jgi:hypothetical protein
MGHEHHVCSKSPQTSEWKKHFSSCNRIINVEARGSSTLFSIVNSVSCLKQYCLPLSVFMGEEHHLLQNHPIQVNGKSTVALVTESLILEARGTSTFFSIVN